MKHFLLLVCLSVLVFSVNAQETEINGCYITVYHTWDKGSSTSFEAYGDVYVEEDPMVLVDLEVKIVSTPREATYKIYKTVDTPQKCGEWRFVKDRNKAKFTIRYVEDWEDCRICFVKDRNKAGFF